MNPSRDEDEALSRLQRERRKGSDRRGDGERRLGTESWQGADQRADPARRKQSRRKVHYGVRFATRRSVESIEDWVESKCSGDCRIILESIDDDLRTKRLLLLFETEGDKALFAAEFGRG